MDSAETSQNHLQPRADEPTSPGWIAGMPALHRNIAICIAFVLLCGLSLYALIVRVHAFQFDDTGMFFRYAMNMRMGYGIAWNPHGEHVGGITSLTWLFVVWLASKLFFHSPGAVYPESQIIHFLAGLSWLFSLAAVGLIGWLCAQRKGSVSPGRLAISVIALYLPMVLNVHFAVVASSGMETMLALFMVAGFIAVLELHAARPSVLTAVFLAVVGIVCVGTRPDTLPFVLILPLSNWFFLRPYRLASLVPAYATFAVLLAVVLVAYKHYFTLALPLPFYLKSQNAYVGYRPYLDGLAYCSFALGICILPLCLCAFAVRRKHLRLILAYIFPVAITFAYLLTVNQIMGIGGRYFVPFTAVILIVAFRIALDADVKWPVRMSLERGCLLCIVLIICTPMAEPLCGLVSHTLVRRRSVYLAPVLVNTKPAPVLPFNGWWNDIHYYTRVASVIPPGGSVAFSEVGMAGALLPRVQIIDTAGLNDLPLIQSHLDTNRIFDRRPDFMTLMNPEYSQLDGQFMTNPHLLAEYDVYSSVFGYGVAVRKDSPYKQAIDQALQKECRLAYGEGFSLSDYRVTSVSWDPKVVRRGVSSDVQYF